MKTCPALRPLLEAVRACAVCAPHLPHGTRPVLQADARARILVAGQAPGRKVHASGVPFDDASGDRLRQWMGLDRDRFYDPALVAILPMGFCFPGSGPAGDRPPRPECAPLWRERLLQALPRIRLTLVIGQYALAWHLPQLAHGGVTAAVHAWRDAAPAVLPLPHPSPRNNRWLAANPWFEQTVVPALRDQVDRLLTGD